MIAVPRKSMNSVVFVCCFMHHLTTNNRNCLHKRFSGAHTSQQGAMPTLKTCVERCDALIQVLSLCSNSSGIVTLHDVTPVGLPGKATPRFVILDKPLGRVSCALSKVTRCYVTLDKRPGRVTKPLVLLLKPSIIVTKRFATKLLR